MSGDGLRDADSLREALPDDVVERAVRAACEVADWHWEPEYNGEHTIIPSPEHSMEPIVLAVIEAIGPTVAAQIDAAREQVAEERERSTSELLRLGDVIDEFRKREATQDRIRERLTAERDDYRERYEIAHGNFLASEQDRDAAVARAEAAEQAVQRVRELHQPKRDHPLSLVQYEHCSCGAMEKVIAPDGYPALGPAPYPCATSRALDGAP